MDSRPVSSKVLRFGLFELDLETQQLRRGGVPLRIQPQPFKVLTVLVSSHGRIVTREELRRELWGTETFVDFEQGLNYCIRQIRAVLGDEAQSPHYIETVPRKGYRFIATIEDAELAKHGHDEQTRGKKSLSRRWGWAVAGMLSLVIALTALVAGMRSRSHPRLTTKDYLLITEFSNQTGDPIFDATLRKAVSIDLGQSPYLNIVADEKIRQTLRLMGKPPDTRVSAEIGREICQRNGIKAMMAGSLVALGNQYLLTLEVTNPASGDVLVVERVQAGGKDEILNVLGQSDKRLREQLGESLSSIHQFDQPLEQVTTSSLQALQLYTLGTEKRGEGELPAIPFFERALQIDPDFALAHASLGTAYLNLEQLQLAEEHEKKAMSLSDRVSEREKFYITAHYYLLLGQRQKVTETYETYSRFYPQDPLPQINLANEYSIVGRYDKALEHALIGLRMAPDVVGVYGSAAESYAALGRLDEAKQVATQGLSLSPDSSWLHLRLSNIAIVQADTEARNREDAALRATPGGNLNLLYRDAALAACRGRLRESEELYSQTSQLALKLGLKDNASFAMGLRAVYEAYLGQPARARESARAALKLSQQWDTIEPVAVALAVVGDDRESERLIDGLAKRRPEDTSVQFIYAPMIHAIALLHDGDSNGALNLLAAGIPYDRGNLDSMLARATALLQAGRAAEAVEEYRAVVSLRKGFPSDPAGALAQLGLARAHVLQGNKDAGREAYQEFLALWKNADPDIPILEQARAEYAKLGPS
ncbi:MAG TPA: winged helix-turn-helix domain-containing protein [Candidatus Dormibacteraeota bacterium]|nr:winged helix-turn-helix domain-containing protein [Candidatus Dormibacteraeota bacterium]